jgi:acyl dehydratase
MRYAQLSPGLVVEAGPRSVTAEEIIQFASRYDAQWFHVNPERAANSRWKGLIASGWHSCAIMMGLAVAAILGDSESYGSPGIEKLQWLEPVRPGDDLRLKAEVLESHRSSSGRTGIVRWRWELWNQTGTKVLTLIATTLFEIAPGAA